MDSDDGEITFCQSEIIITFYESSRAIVHKKKQFY